MSFYMRLWPLFPGLGYWLGSGFQIKMSVFMGRVRVFRIKINVFVGRIDDIFIKKKKMFSFVG